MTDGPLDDQRTDTQHAPPLLRTRFDVNQIAAVRHALARCLRAAGLSGERLDDFVTAINEAMTNAVRHGGGHGELWLWRGDPPGPDGELVCEVHDRGPGFADTLSIPRSRPLPSPNGGMGLWLARELADALAVHSDSHGVRVRLTMALRPSAGQIG